uniref:Uncharacterized protein n=1 Tax=Anguilla anguilla TaxID=7936 RepID=A0A0E9TTY4_ANGAN
MMLNLLYCNATALHTYWRRLFAYTVTRKYNITHVLWEVRNFFTFCAR